ncbi:MULTISPECIES: lytic transglycosylase domain-containing protein [unclassified Sphingobium]|uniref:lytic murein transglycosylase n=1 Tax=unclassified Sphingobium TaxID=2611147 RepID=UPI0022245EB6|nr:MULTISPECIES: lytic murein transglycosylase [unclassified Sphingobium]MCW2415640.1 lytic murein transglycosylase [Sphingobium sp. B8D3A]
MTTHSLRRRLLPLCGLALGLSLATHAPAVAQALPSSNDPVDAQTAAGFTSYLESLRGKARAQGVSDATFDRAIAGLSFNPRVAALDRGNLPTADNAPIPDFEPYRQRHIDARKIARGRAVYNANRALLVAIERDAGVPEEIMVAIYGHETNYGTISGDFDLLRSLATLAYEGRRRALFEPELLAVMAMMQRGVPRERLVGSYAGAFGYPQFLPSVYLRDAVDADGDGTPNIWSSEPDALASIANYFQRAGWRKGEPWGVAVRLPTGFDRGRIASTLNPTRCPRVFGRHSRWLSMREWQALGIMPEGGSWPDGSIQATLIEPDGPGKTAYLLTGNYRVILDYNCSNFYALSVGLLADAVRP